MDILPVIDILNGVAVQARKGARDEYAPIVSPLTSDSDPVLLAAAFKEKFHFESVYIADLDAIIHGRPNEKIIEKIATRLNLKIYLDSGIRSRNDFSRGGNLLAHKIVVGTETINDLDVINQARHFFMPEKVVVSLDTKAGKLFGSSKNEAIDSVFAVIAQAQIKEIIILDLDYVGSERGMSPYIKTIIQRYKDENVQFITGGGVRNAYDIAAAEALGCSKIMVGTVLHNRDI